MQKSLARGGGVLRKIAAVKILPRLTRLAVFAGLASFVIGSAAAQTGQPSGQFLPPPLIGVPAPPPTQPGAAAPVVEATATISLGAAGPVTSVCRKGRFERVSLQHDQVVTITLSYALTTVGHTIVAEPLDGGRVIGKGGKPLLVGADGTLSFQFQAAHEPGVCQIALHDGPRETGLQFWVVDPQHPENTPPVVNP